MTEPVTAPEGPCTAEPPLERRALLRGLGAAAAAGAGLAIAGTPFDASPADASTGTMQFGAQNNAGGDSTALISSSPGWTYLATNTGSGDGIDISVTGSGDGIFIDTAGGHGVYVATGGVGVFVTTDTDDAIVGNAGIDAGASAGIGVHGTSDGPFTETGFVAGVLGETDVSGREGVAGLSVDGTGVHGVSVGSSSTFTGFVAGVVGESNDTSAPREGVVGLSETGDGTAGYSNAAHRSGVYGENRSTGVGVGAFTTNGTGVNAVSTNGTGVVGTSTASIGVQGQSMGAGSGVKALSATGHAVEAISGGTTPTIVATNSTSGGGGPALQVNGKASFSRSGKIAVPSGASSVTQTGISLASGSLVLATIQKHLGGFQIEAAVPNVSGSKLTIFFNKPAPAATTVAWFVVN